jgi:hypothetical protein
MDSLTEKLATGDHPVEISIRPEATLERFKACIDRGYVHVKFTDTRGGTELGVELDKEASNVSSGNFEQGTGTVRLVGGLTLNYDKVRCIADIDLGTLTGQGHLEPAGV